MDRGHYCLEDITLTKLSIYTTQALNGSEGELPGLNEAVVHWQTGNEGNIKKLLINQLTYSLQLRSLWHHSHNNNTFGNLLSNPCFFWQELNYTDRRTRDKILHMGVWYFDRRLASETKCSWRWKILACLCLHQQRWHAWASYNRRKQWTTSYVKHIFLWYV